MFLLRKDKSDQKNFQCKMSLKLKKSIEISIRVFLKQGLICMMNPTVQCQCQDGWRHRGHRKHGHVQCMHQHTTHQRNSAAEYSDCTLYTELAQVPLGVIHICRHALEKLLQPFFFILMTKGGGEYKKVTNYDITCDWEWKGAGVGD